MKVYEIARAIEEVAPIPLQENYDNSGLQVGNPQMDVTSALVCIDVTEKIIEEARRLGCNLVISHHPLIFSGIKSLTGKNYVERTVISAIRYNIALYAAHTNLDNVRNGVNYKLAEKIGLQQIRILEPQKNRLMKLVAFVPGEAVEKVKTALFEAGAGAIGDYESCAYSSEGSGEFKPKNGSQPYRGRIGTLYEGPETRIEVILPQHIKNGVTNALLAAHPYEEPVYDLIALQNDSTTSGSGVYGILPEPIDEQTFLREVQRKLQAGSVRYTALRGKPISTVALCGGAGAFLIPSAKRVRADIFIIGEIKYHDFFGHEDELILAEYGHYETEQYTKEIFCDIITKKFPTFAVHYTKENTNPINYL